MRPGPQPFLIPLIDRTLTAISSLRLLCLLTEPGNQGYSKLQKKPEDRAQHLKPRQAMASTLSLTKSIVAQTTGDSGSLLPPDPPAVHPLKTLGLDAEGIAKKYAEERAKRLRGDGVAQFKALRNGAFSHFKDDTLAPVSPRDPIRSETTVVIVGGGFAGLITAVELKRRGVTDFLIIDRAGGFGGTWYWNQYPGM